MVVVPLPSCPLACPLALWPPCPPRPLPRARLKQVAARPPPGSRSRGGLIGPAALGRPGQCRNRSRQLPRRLCRPQLAQLPRRLCRPQLRPPRPRCVSGAPGLTNHKPFQTGPTGPTRTRRDRVKGRARRRRRAHRRPQSRPEQRRERQERSKQRPWSVSRRRQSRGGPSAEEGQGLWHVGSRFEGANAVAGCGGGPCEAERAGSGRRAAGLVGGAREPLSFP